MIRRFRTRIFATVRVVFLRFILRLVLPFNRLILRVNRTLLIILAEQLHSRYRQLGRISDIDGAVDAWRNALNLTPDDDMTKPVLYNSLGVVCLERFERSGDLQDLEEAVAKTYYAVQLTPTGCSEPTRLTNCANALHRRFQSRGNIDDLQLAITMHTRAIELTTDDHPHRPALLSNLGIVLHARFGLLGDAQDLHSSIENDSRAVELTSKGHPDMPFRLNNLACALYERFQLSSNPQDLEDALQYQLAAVDSTPNGHLDLPARLSNLGNLLRERFDTLGSNQDLTLAVSHLERAVKLTPEGHISMPLRLSNLAVVLRDRCEQLGDFHDLDTAIARQTSAVELTPEGHTTMAGMQNNLGNMLHERYQRRGDLRDLEAAIAKQAHTVELTLEGDITMPPRLNNLSNLLFERFQHLDSISDLNAAIEKQERAVELLPHGHANIPGMLGNLGSFYHERFYQLGDVEDLEKALKSKSHAVELTSDNHIDLASWLNNLGNILYERFQHLDDPQDLQAAIEKQLRSVELTPQGHIDMPSRLGNLGNTLHERFQRFGDSHDLEAALEKQNQAIELTPSGHSGRAQLLVNLGHTLITRSASPYATPNDLSLATETYMHAFHERSGNPAVRLRAGITYIKLLSSPSIPSSRERLLEAYGKVLTLIPEVVWLGHNVHRRYEELVRYGKLANQAAAYAIFSGELARAVEWLESGRAIVWSQLLHLRSPLEKLQDQHPELASDLSRVSRILQSVSTLAQSDDLPTAFGIQSIDESLSTDSLDELAQSHYSLALKYEDLLSKIREKNGFEDFLRPKKLSQLAPACTSGPVVIINVHEMRCDALVMYGPGSNILHVPLPELDHDHAKALQQWLWVILREERLLERPRDSRQNGARRAWKRPSQNAAQIPGDNVLSNILSELWDKVAKPIVNAVMPHLSKPENGAQDLPHITWCTTGPLVFLPLHASGTYSESDSEAGPLTKLMDIVVSSYAPTLEVLLRSRTEVTSLSYSSDLDYPKILVVAQPYTDGYAPIPDTEEEVEVISSIFPHSTTACLRDEGTVSNVLKHMLTHSWAHLACHGIQDPTDPTQSSFVLHDGRLRLSTLIPKLLPQADLAVLSACQTATGNETLSEEAVHMAAAMLSVGYRSVIGTMWSIPDDSGPIISRKFYEIMQQQVTARKPLRPAYALHEAIKTLRHEIEEDEFMKWVPFVHFGL